MMKACVNTLLFCGMILLTSSIANAQDSTIVLKFNESKAGIPITKTDFDSKVSNYLKLMGEWTRFDTAQYIDMVRLYNTIGGELPIKNDFYKMYYTVFLVMYHKNASKQLEAEFSTGMAMYSKNMIYGSGMCHLEIIIAGLKSSIKTSALN